MEVTVHDATRGLMEGWDEFVHREALPSGWYGEPLRAYARAAPWRVLLLQVRTEGAIGVQLVALDGTGFRQRSRYASSGWRPPTLWSCRLPVSANRGFAFAGGTVPRQRRLALRAAARSLAGRALTLVYQFVGEDDLHLFDGWLLRRRTSDAGVFEVRWTHHEAYLASLPGRRRRKVLERMASVESDPAVVPFEAGRVDAVEAARLDLLTRARQLRRRSLPLPVGYFSALGQVPGTRFFGYRDAGGRMRAVDVVLGGGRELLGTVTGSDGEASRGGLTLSLYDREIRHAIETGATALDFGPGQLDLKRRLGCAPRARWLVGLPGPGRRRNGT